METEVLLVMTGERTFRWQSKLPPDELAQRLRTAAERIEEQIIEGVYDEQLAAVGR